MLAEFQFDTPLLRTTVRESTVTTVTIENLGASEEVPLRAVCWLEGGSEGSFEAALSADRTVEDATRVVDTDRGTQYDVTCDPQPSGQEMYYAAVEEAGIYVSGVRRSDHWEVQMRFPDREAFDAFRTRIEGGDISLQSLHEQESGPRAEQYGISDPQREILHLASRQGYFDVPRRASLADLADDLAISSQAASERLRRGLDSLVERTLLTTE
jgi:predicted DNA binding protein